MNVSSEATGLSTLIPVCPTIVCLTLVCFLCVCSPGGDVEKGVDEAQSEANTTFVLDNLGLLAPEGRVKLWTTGVPIRCPGGTWTEEEGAKTVDECGEPYQTSP